MDIPNSALLLKLFYPLQKFSSWFSVFTMMIDVILILFLQYIPGTKNGVPLTQKATKRADLISYLKEATA